MKLRYKGKDMKNTNPKKSIYRELTGRYFHSLPLPIGWLFFILKGVICQKLSG